MLLWPYSTAICNHGCARYGRTRVFDVGVVITNKPAEMKSFSGPLFQASLLATINSDKHLCSSIGRRMMLPLLLAAISLSSPAERITRTSELTLVYDPKTGQLDYGDRG